MTMLNGKSTAAGILCLLLMLLAPPSKALLISLEAADTSVASGEQIGLQLWARDLGTEIVSGFELDVNFNSSLMGFDNSLFGDALGNGIDSLQDSLQRSGSINLAEISFLSDAELEGLQSNGGSRVDVLLASLFFTGSSVGIAEFSLSFDPVFGGVFGSGATDLTFDLPSQPILIEVQAALAAPVSEPNQFAMILMMLISLVVAAKFSGRVTR